MPYNIEEGRLAQTSLSTKEVTTRLERLARLGCHVILLLDVNHPNAFRVRKELSPSRGLKEWTRQLHEAKVSVFLAAVDAPSQEAGRRG